MGGEQHLLVVAAGVVRRLDDQEPVHSGIEAAGQIAAGDVVAVIPAGARGLGGEGVAPRAAALDHGGAFLHRAVGLSGQIKTVPVNDVVDIGVVADVDADLATLAQPQERTGHGAVVGEGVDDFSGRELEPQRRDAQRIVSRIRDLRIGPPQRRAERHSRRAGAHQEATAMHPRSRRAVARQCQRCGHGCVLFVRRFRRLNSIPIPTRGARACSSREHEVRKAISI
jgi:hypothetical protein